MRGLLEAAVAGLTITAAPLAATAAPRPGQPVRIDIPSQPRQSALFALAGRFGISIDTSRLGQCRPGQVAFSGTYDLAQALTKALAGSQCGYRVVGDDAVVVLPLPAPPPARQAAAPPQAETSAPDIVSTLLVRAPSGADAGASPNAVRGAQSLLDNQDLVSLSDLATINASLFETNLGPGRDKVIVRGLSDGPIGGDAQSVTALYFDRARLTYNAPDPDILLVDMAAVEIVRGPQGAGDGAGALGGEVHLLPRRPDPTLGMVQLDAEATSGGSGKLDGIVNLPLGGEAAIRLVAYRQVQGGYLDNAGAARRNANRTVATGWRAAIAAPLFAAWRLDGELISQGINTDDAQYVLGFARQRTRQVAMLEPHDNDFRQAQVTATHEGADLVSSVTLAYDQHRLETRYDASSSPAAQGGAAAFDQSQGIDGLSLEASWATQAHPIFNWKGGIFLARTDQKLDSALWRLPGLVSPYAEQRRQQTTEAALFGRGALRLSPKWTLSGGARLFKTQVSATNRTRLAVGAPAQQASDRQDRDGVAPRLSLQFAPSDSWTIYGELARGYRSGGFTTAPTDLVGGGAAGGGLTPYRADGLWTIELGSRLDLFQDRLRLQGAVFAARWRNLQSDQIQASGLFYTANLGDARNLGLEFEGLYHAGRFEFRSGLMVNAPELEQPSSGARGDEPLSSTPRLTAGFSGTYGIPVGAGLDLKASFRANYVGATHLALLNAPDRRTSPHVDTRLSVTLAAREWALNAAIDNLLDQRVNTFAFGNPFTIASQPQATPSAPRRFTLGLSLAH